MRISFVGGGTDIPRFYHKHRYGAVLSTTIDKYVYVCVQETPLSHMVSAKYSLSESVDDVEKIKNSRVREALKMKDIRGGVEIGSFADLPAGLGLGSSSSFSVALLAALDPKMSEHDLAREACRLELDILKEPIGRQDQYAAALGGFKHYSFVLDEKLGDIVGYSDFPPDIASELEPYILLLFVGGQRDAGEVLKKINLDSLNQKAESEAWSLLAHREYENFGKLIDSEWSLKRSLGTSTPGVDSAYERGIGAGAWGGKLCGAGGGGCLLFVAPPEKHHDIIKATGLTPIPIKFTNEGVCTWTL